MEINFFGRGFMALGLFLVLLGLVLTFAKEIPWLGRLPGDIYIHKRNFTFYFPLATCILLSIVISLILFLFSGRR